MRSVLVVGVLLLAFARVPATATAPGTAARGVTLTYSQAGGIAHVPFDSGTELYPGDWQQVGATEDHVRIAVHDASGNPVALNVDYQQTPASPVVTTVVCGPSSLVRVAHRSRLRVTPMMGQCPDGSWSWPSSGTIGITFVRPLPPSRIIPADRRWAVIIGISHYAGSTHPTVGGVGDAEAIRRSLLAAGWRSDHLLVLTDAAATGQAIVDAMSWLAARSSPTSYSLFHFSGHACIASRGPCAAGHTYLWGVDNAFVPETTVSALLGQVEGPAWFDFAACESGAFDDGLHSSLRLVTAASQPHETAYEQPDWHESVWSGLVFDRAFLQGRVGDSPRRASVAQMVDYGQTQAPLITGNERAGTQHPYAAGGLAHQSLYAPHF